jgi:hypothetical protein
VQCALPCLPRLRTSSVRRVHILVQTRPRWQRMLLPVVVVARNLLSRCHRRMGVLCRLAYALRAHYSHALDCHVIGSCQHGNANALGCCERCHVPERYLEGLLHSNGVRTRHGRDEPSIHHGWSHKRARRRRCWTLRDLWQAHSSRDIVHEDVQFILTPRFCLR